MEEMRATEILRLIEWLKAQGFTSEQIVECIEYINKKKRVATLQGKRYPHRNNGELRALPQPPYIITGKAKKVNYEVNTI